MRKTLTTIALALIALTAMAQGYVPTQENLAEREDFRNAKLGIFLHWGIYSMFAQGEWYLQNAVPDRMEYAKAPTPSTHTASTHANGCAPSRPQELNTSASPHATTTDSPCGTRSKATTTS